MKLRKWIAITTVLATLCVTGCTPAADNAATSGSTTSSASSTASSSSSAGSSASADASSETEVLDVLDTADYKEVQTLEEVLPLDELNLSGTKEDGTPWKIAWSSLNNAQESMAYMTGIMEDVAEEYGFEMITLDAQNDPQKQTSDVNSAITQGCDALIIVPIDTTSQNAVMSRAMEAGMLVVCAQLPTDDDSCYDVYVGQDDIEAGQLSASYLIETMPEGGNVVVIEGNPGEACQINRKAGFEGVMAGHPEFTILDSQAAQAWSTSEAVSVMDSYLAKYPDIDAVYCHWDIGAEAAIQAIEAAGREDEIVVLGSDGIQAALDDIKAGTLFKCTALMDFELASKAQVLATLACLNGDGDKIGDNVHLKYVCVTQENAGDFNVGW